MMEMDEARRPLESPDVSSETPADVGVEPSETEEIKHPESSKEARNMAMLCHLLGIVGFFAPLVIWLIEKDKHRFVDEHGRTAMNYQVSIMIYFAAAWLLLVLTRWLDVLIIGNYVLNVLFVVHIILVIIGAVKASRGNAWRYPIAIPFLK